MENNLPNRPPKKKTKKGEAILACVDRHRIAHHAFGFLIHGVRLWVPLRRMAEGQSEGCSAAPYFRGFQSVALGLLARLSEG